MTFLTGKKGLSLYMVLALAFALAACIDREYSETTADVHHMPGKSTFFSTAHIEGSSSYNVKRSNGDLWPAAWADDGYMYAANGDGTGFDPDSGWADIVVNRFSGHPGEENIAGKRLAGGEAISQVWTDETRYNKKPTGMISVEGDLYLAVQDLNKVDGPQKFNDVPAATILKSTDNGKTWTWDTEKPMFSDYTFTTIIFLDYGQDSELNTFDDYVYAYGMDYNWRDSFGNTVPDPNKLYLARMPKDGIQDRDTWEFYRGDLEGNARWSEPGDIDSREPVLQDNRRIYTDLLFDGVADQSVISQGSIVYNEPFDRYLYTSWTEYTFEFYESPTPWGPWKRFLTKDFGLYPWNSRNHGGYATTIPSKYISEDGRKMWVNSQTFAGGFDNYQISFRELHVTPYTKTSPENEPDDKNLALPENTRDVTPIARAATGGDISVLNDGEKTEFETSWTGHGKDEDWWGYTWSQAYNLNKLEYTTGAIDETGGGWLEDLKIQVRQEFEWIEVENVSITPGYPYYDAVEAHTTYNFTFDETWGDGIRIIGAPGGREKYTTVSELEVYYCRADTSG